MTFCRINPKESTADMAFCLVADDPGQLLAIDAALSMAG